MSWVTKFDDLEVRNGMAIHDGAAEQDLERHARALTPSIRQGDDGQARVIRGETTLEEILRVTRED